MAGRRPSNHTGVNMRNVSINGMVISTGGRNIIVSGNKVLIDGIDVTPDAKEIKIEVQGDIDKLEVDNCESILVIGNVKSLSTLSGDVNIKGNVEGTVSSVSGDVRCNNVGGSVQTVSGNIG